MDDVTVARSAEGTSLRVRVSFDASRIVFTKRGDRHVADVDLAVKSETRRSPAGLNSIVSLNDVALKGQFATRVGITGTPTFLFGRVSDAGVFEVIRRESGAIPYTAFATILDDILARRTGNQAQDD